MQQTKVARRRAGLGSQVEDVDCRGEEEGELQGVADGREGVGCWIVGWEDGDVQGVVLGACQCLCLILYEIKSVNERDMETHIAADDAEAGDGGYCGRHGVACGL